MSANRSNSKPKSVLKLLKRIPGTHSPRERLLRLMEMVTPKLWTKSVYDLFVYSTPWSEWT